MGEYNKKFLAVTGITGKSGLYFLEAVLRHEDDVMVKWGGIRFISRDEGKAEKVLNKASGAKVPFTKIIGDINNYDDSKEFCKGCDTLLHIAGIHFSRVVVKAAVDAGVKRMILVHTTGIYSKYKYAGEEYRQTDDICYKLCEENGVGLTILRPTMIYGNLRDGNVSVFIRMVDKLPLMPTVNGARYELQPVWCGDLGKAYYQVLMNENTIGCDYILSGGKPIELRSMFEVIGEQLGKDVKFISCPYPIAYAGAWLVYVLTLGHMDYREKVQRLVEPRVYSHKDATRDFSYNPLNFEEGIRAEVEMYKKRHGNS